MVFFIINMNSFNLSNTKRSFLMHFYIKKEKRSQGFGVDAFESLKSLLFENNINELDIDVLSQNEVAMNFWQKKM